MKILRWISILGVVVFAGSCDPGDIFGPNTAVVTARVVKLVPGSAEVRSDGTIEKVKIDGDWMSVGDAPGFEFLVDDIPDREYRIRVQTLETRSHTTVERGGLSMNLRSAEFGMSRTKYRSVREDRVAVFEFRSSDFRSFTLRNVTSDLVMVMINDGDGRRLVRLGPGETKDVPVDWRREYDIRVENLRTGEAYGNTVRPGEDDAEPILNIRSPGISR